METTKVKTAFSFVMKNTWPSGLEHGWGNGYAALPEGHPLFGMDYDAIHDLLPIDVNGGLTFAAQVQALDNPESRWPKEAEGMWVIGFDTAHSWDTELRWPDEASVKAEADHLLNQVIDFVGQSPESPDTHSESKIEALEKEIAGLKLALATKTATLDVHEMIMEVGEALEASSVLIQLGASVVWDDLSVDAHLQRVKEARKLFKDYKASTTLLQENNP